MISKSVMSELQMKIARKGLRKKFGDMHSVCKSTPIFTPIHFLTIPRFYNQTSGHRFRAKNDIQYAFLYSHYVIENDLIKSTVYDGKKFGAYIPAVSAMKNYLQPSFIFPYSQKYLWLCNQAGTSPKDSNYQKIRNQGTGSDSFSTRSDQVHAALEILI